VTARSGLSCGALANWYSFQAVAQGSIAPSESSNAFTKVSLTPDPQEASLSA
jgi:hypothetical protein